MSTVNRNQSCPCGSGKKYKKCCINKIPRKQHLYVGHDEPYNGVSWENGDMYVHLLSGKKVKADHTFIQSAYNRKNGKEKVLNRVPSVGSPDLLYHIANKFDMIFAIDTNTKKIGEDTISIASMMECRVRKQADQVVNLSYGKHGNIALVNCPDGKYEPMAWAGFISEVSRFSTYSHDKQVALVTDHDLENHGRYNRRELPIFQNFYLPRNFTLLYASSDKKDNFLNLLLKECDKDARIILLDLEKNGTAVAGSTTISLTKNGLVTLKNSE